MAILDAVADAAGRDPLDLPPIYETVDPDALDGLLGGSAFADSSLAIRFEYAGHVVIARSDGEVIVTETPVR